MGDGGRLVGEGAGGKGPDTQIPPAREGEGQGPDPQIPGPE